MDFWKGRRTPDPASVERSNQVSKTLPQQDLHHVPLVRGLKFNTLPASTSWNITGLSAEERRLISTPAGEILIVEVQKLFL